MQLQGMEKAKAEYGGAGMPGKEAPKYSVRRGLAVIWREEGLRGYYRGHLTNLLHVAPAAAARFYAFELCRGVRGLALPLWR